MKFAIGASLVCTGEEMVSNTAVVIESGRIVDLIPVFEVDCGIELLPNGCILAPGFVDLQVNGGGGVLFNEDISSAALYHIASAHRRVGTTSLLPTLISGTRGQIGAALTALRAVDHCSIIGLHIEGPFINLLRRGIHPAAHLIAMTEADVTVLSAPLPGRLLVTLAPECVAPSMITRLIKAGVTVFAGHTDATYQQACVGLEAGITGFTHLFNAMSPLGARAPGAVGAALTRRCYASIIVDGLHVHPASLAVVVSAKSPDNLILVSDAMATAASSTDRFTLAGEAISLNDGRLTDAQGTLAGAHLTMAAAVRNAVDLLGLTPAQAIRMATATPADAIGISDIGRLRRGARADLVALDPSLTVTKVWQGGVEVS